MAVDLLPYDDRDGFIWLDGALVPWRDARLHVLSHALHYASAVFEGERVYDGHIFRSRAHTERLHNSARLMGFEIPWSVDVLEDAKRDVLQANGLKDAYVRPVAWRGAEMMGVSAQDATIHVAIAAWFWGAYFGDGTEMSGIRMKTGRYRRPGPECGPVQAKATGHYLICTLNKHEVEAEGYHDALFLDTRGFIAEGSGANIFLVQDGKLHTPTPDSFLNGITRQAVIDLAGKRQIPVVERSILPEEFANTTEVFVTGTAAEVTPVAEIDDYRFTPGEITRTLMEDFRAITSTG